MSQSSFHIVPLLLIFKGMENENPYAHINKDGNKAGLEWGTLIPFMSQLYNISPSPSQTRVGACWWVLILIYRKKEKKKERKINPSPHVPTRICIFVWMGRMIFPKLTTLHQSTKSLMNKFISFMPIHFFEKRA